MDITIKCPNCYQQVSKENRFCIFCGYDLSDEKTTLVDETTSTTVYESVDHSMTYDGPRFCPKGHDVTDPSLGFCPICGSPLVNEPAVERKPEAESPSIPVTRRGKSRTCECGYVCDDPDLVYCPACGLPLGTSTSPESSGWKCACGNINGLDLAFCEECGKPKGWHPSDSSSSHDDVVVEVPSGMKPPSDLDLVVKSKYGN